LLIFNKIYMYLYQLETIFFAAIIYWVVFWLNCIYPVIRSYVTPLDSINFKFDLSNSYSRFWIFMNWFQSCVPYGTIPVIYSAPIINFMNDSVVLLIVDKNNIPSGFNNELIESMKIFLFETCSMTSIAVMISN